MSPTAPASAAAARRPHRQPLRVRRQAGPYALRRGSHWLAGPTRLPAAPAPRRAQLLPPFPRAPCPPKPPPSPSCSTARRLHIAFDRFDETEGAWIDDNDEWHWLPMPRNGVPPAVPVPGAWRPGLSPGPIEKIYLTRLEDEDVGTEFLVKWKELAHIHCQWVPQLELEVDPDNRSRVKRYLKSAAALELSGGTAEPETWDLGGDVGEGARTEEEPYNPDFEIVDRVGHPRPCPPPPGLPCPPPRAPAREQVIAEAPGVDDLPPRFLVKWRSLPYLNATWESCRTLLEYDEIVGPRSISARFDVGRRALFS